MELHDAVSAEWAYLLAKPFSFGVYIYIVYHTQNTDKKAIAGLLTKK